MSGPRSQQYTFGQLVFANLASTMVSVILFFFGYACVRYIGQGGESLAVGFGVVVALVQPPERYR